MPSRVIAFLLVAVLFWSGFNTVEAPRAHAQPLPAQATATVDAAVAAACHDGPVDPHHLDDLLTQALGELSPETPGLLPAAPASSGAWMTMLLPRSLASAESGPPFLAGPLRPPCSAAGAA